MQTFDPDFEHLRLTMLAKQFPEMVKVSGEVEFFAEETEDTIALTRFTLDEEIMSLCDESDFKIFLINLLNIFIEYRGECNHLPRKTGRLKLHNNKMEIEWLT